MSRPAVLGTALAALVLVACGSPSKVVDRTPSPAVPASEMRVLAPSAVPGLPATTRVLTIAELAKDAPVHGIAARLSSWGYLDGRERAFQGESRNLTTVISRALVFRDARGAGAYVAFVRAHSAAFFGTGTGVRALTSQGRTGWVFSPPACACHLANPVLVGVMDDGARVVWLDINGPRATRGMLVRLLNPSASAPTTVAG